MSGSLPEARTPVLTDVNVAREVGAVGRSCVVVTADMTQERIETDALSDPKVAGLLDGKKVRRVVYVPRRLVNIVLEG